MLVRKGNTFFEFTDDVICHVVWGGIFMNTKKGGFDKQILESKFNSSMFVDTYSAINISNLQTVFFLSISGYVLALAYFVTEIMWHYYWSKRRERKCTSPCHEQTLINWSDKTVWITSESIQHVLLQDASKMNVSTISCMCLRKELWSEVLKVWFCFCVKVTQ
jgi:hypothetical protein